MPARRYKVEANWHGKVSDTVRDWLRDEVATVTREYATLTDTRTGDRFDRGAIRFTVTAKGGFRKSKTFIGETAWSDGERWANDEVNAASRRAVA